MVTNWALLITSVYLVIYYILLLVENRERRSEGESEPEVTIALPAYNEADNIERALKSLAELDYPPEKLHVIVVDDGSSDGTYEVAKRFAERSRIDITVVRHEKNRGKGAALNTAISLTETPYLVTMDADSYVDPGALRAMLRKAGTSDAVAACIFPDRVGGIAERVQEIEYLMSNYLAHILSRFDAQLVTPGPFSLFRMEVLRDLGGFDENAPAEDLEIVFRMRKKGYKLDFAPDAHVYTEIPKDLRGLVKQRRRWKLGVFDTIEKHPHFLLPTTIFAEQVFISFIFSVSVLVLFALTIYTLYKKLDKLYVFLRAVGLDIFPFLRNFELKFDIYYLDPQTLFYSLLGVVLTVILLTVMFNFFEGRKMGWKDFLLYVFLYPGALITAYLLAFKDWIKRDYRW